VEVEFDYRKKFTIEAEEKFIVRDIKQQIFDQRKIPIN
jgi:hypothetical protein